MELSMDPWYATREDVMSATDVKASAHVGTQIDADLEMASRTAEELLHRKFYPWTGTRYFDFPDQQNGATWRVWFEQFMLVSLTSAANGDGVAISTSDLFLNPQDGPPYEWVESDIGSDTSFTSGNTWQRTLGFTGVWGHSNNQQPAGSLVAGINTSVTTAVVNGTAAIGVGSLLTIGTERLIVTERSNYNTTLTLSSDIASSAGVVAVPISSATNITVGETITIDSEKMLVVDKASNTLTVKRAVSGSVLASHTTGAAVYAPWSLTVVRGQTGTSAASASTSAAVTAWLSPGPVKMLTVALAVAAAQQRTGGWTKAKADALDQLIKQTKAVYRRIRHGVV